MTVRRKTLMISAVTCLGLMAALFGAARGVILENARETELDSGNRDMRRMLNILDERMSALDRFNRDRSSQDDTYDFVAHPNRQMDETLFGEDNQTNPVARQFGFLILLDNFGHSLAERKFYLLDGKSREIPETLRVQLVPGNALLQHIDLKQSTKGVVMTSDSLLVFKVFFWGARSFSFCKLMQPPRNRALRTLRAECRRGRRAWCRRRAGDA